MPELPEVETIRRKLEPNLTGKTIGHVEVLTTKQFIGIPGNVIGKEIISLRRTGKVINVHLTGGQILNIHLKMTGQLLFAPHKNHRFKSIIPFAKSDVMPGRTTRIVVGFTDGSTLYFNDLRKFGWMKIGLAPDGPKAPDVLNHDFTETYFKQVIKHSNKPIKTLLMDQEKISGIGNIYANDALFLAGIKPTRKSSSLTGKSIDRLYHAVKKVINQGLADLGSTGGDEAFVLPDGTRGSHQFHFLVYDRENQPCTTCGTAIKRLKHGGRSSFYCPKCQK